MRLLTARHFSRRIVGAPPFGPVQRNIRGHEDRLPTRTFGEAWDSSSGRSRGVGLGLPYVYRYNGPLSPVRQGFFRASSALLPRFFRPKPLSPPHQRDSGIPGPRKPTKIAAAAMPSAIHPALCPNAGTET